MKTVVLSCILACHAATAEARPCGRPRLGDALGEAMGEAMGKAFADLLLAPFEALSTLGGEKPPSESVTPPSVEPKRPVRRSFRTRRPRLRRAIGAGCEHVLPALPLHPPAKTELHPKEGE